MTSGNRLEGRLEIREGFDADDLRGSDQGGDPGRLRPAPNQRNCIDPAESAQVKPLM